MPFLIQLVLLTVFGVVASVIANSKGRSTVGWFFGGFFLGVVGVVIVAVLPNLKVQREKEARIERENRRLRERLRQEQVKSESFRRHTTARLDVHDEQLGLDTRSLDALPESGQPPLQLAGDSEADELSQLAAARDGTPPPPAGSRDWYYERNGEVHGPLRESHLADLFATRQLAASTLVWTEDLGDWTEARAIGRLQPHLRQA